MEQPHPTSRRRPAPRPSPDTALTVAPAERTELPALGSIWRELMDLHAETDPRFALAEDALDRWLVTAEEMLERQQAFLLAARLSHKPVGFCLGWIARNPPIYRVPEVGFISEIAVTRAHQRHGVGRALVHAAAEFFRQRGVSEFQLSTAEWNRQACAFWQKLGGELLLLRYRFPLDHPVWQRKDDSDEPTF